jgi:hypothetical protein
MATSVQNELVVWNDTTATEVTSAAGSGTVKLTNGVYSLGNPASFQWISGRYYDVAHNMALGTWGGSAMTALRLCASPIYVPNDVTLSEIAINVTAAVASSLARVAMYNVGSDGKPGTLLFQGASTLDTGASTGEKILTESHAVTGGKWYYLAVVSDAAISIHGGPTITLGHFGWPSHSSTSREGMFYKALGSLTIPDPFGTPTGPGLGLFRVSVKVA